MKTLDLRSDTVTRPTPEMTAAMNSAAVGDDVYGEDPTANRLEELGAEILRKGAALFCPSGTQSNLAALLTHCGRGDEYIVGQQAHTYRYEGGGAAVFGGIQPQPLNFRPNGTLDLGEVEANIKRDDFHFARTRLLCLENTHKGIALPLGYLEQCREFAREKNLRLHLDGARLFNAARKLDIDAHTIAGLFDSVSICLSKGLGAPVGSLLVGEKDFIAEARRWRKVLGGGMRQIGTIAAAGVYALENNIDRLSEDQHNAEALARGLGEVEEIEVIYGDSQTNMLFITLPEPSLASLHVYLRQRGIIIPGDTSVRLVTHLEIDRRDIDYIIATFKDFYSAKRSAAG
ncbi:MAG TPA: low-specificity L-threonine aldolase [Desulfopila sp.]|nr:low-specificity L-threonine aldolase [Desulfopila sp.]